MMLMLEPTAAFADANGQLCRVWKGVTDKGTEVWALVAGVAAPSGADQADLEAEMIAIDPPQITPGQRHPWST